MKIRFFVINFISFICLLQKDLMGASASTKEENCELSSAQLLGCNPLKNFKSFAIHPQYAIALPELRTKVNEDMTQKLEKIGKVKRLKVPDPTGYGKAQARMTIFLKEITAMERKTFPVTQAALFIASPTLIQKTGVQCSTYVWSVETFAEGNIKENNQKNILTSFNLLIDQFIEEYQKANPDKKERPVFYIYTL